MSAKSTRNRRRFLCEDCRTDTGKIGEFYFVHTTLWLTVMHSIDGMLCVGCLEGRLGRTLTARDFTDASINHSQRGVFQSARLRNRLENHA